MPTTEVVFFATGDGAAPALEWLDTVPAKARYKCIVRMERLAEMGYELRRPEGDYLREGIYELRVRHQRVNYRLLYFFHQGVAVISHGLTKERRVPSREIDPAVLRQATYSRDPAKHTFSE